LSLYRPQGGHGLGSKAIRTGWPYLASHEGWYINISSPSEEDAYYFDSCGPNWSARMTRVEEIIAEREQKYPRILHIGCGNDLIPWYINLDNSNDPRLDITFDLNDCAGKKIPISDNSIDGIYRCHMFEHITDTLSMMSELHRIAKPNCKMVLRLPYGSSNDAVEDPTHVRTYFEDSFVYFSQPAYSRTDYCYNGDWDIDRIRLILPKALQRVPNKKLRQMIRTDRNVVIEMIVNLRAVKPVRERSHQVLKWPVAELVFSSIDGDSKFTIV
jgi:SAM-dependent methyltransferase